MPRTSCWRISKDFRNFEPCTLIKRNSRTPNWGISKRLRHLQQLGLDRTQIGDAALENFKGLTELNVLFLRFTKVTDEGVKDLQQALPNCTIYH